MLDYHMHTTVRDGKHSIDEMIEFATIMGLTEVGISEHWGMWPDDWEKYYGSEKYLGEEFKELKTKKIAPYSMRGSLYKYFLMLKDAKEKFKDQITVKSGLEMDLYESNFDQSIDMVMTYKPDYIIGAIHALNGIGYHSFESLDNVTEDDYENILKAYIGFAKRGKFQILGHFEDYRIFNPMKDERRFYDLYEELICACKESNIAIEFNTSHLTYRYRIDPNLFWLKTCAKYEVPVILTSDAHNKYTIANKFDFSFTLLEQAGVKVTAKFTDCVMEKEEIDYKEALSFIFFWPLEKPWVI